MAVERGIDKHIESLRYMFTYAPDTRIKQHPVKLGQGDRTTVIGVMEGTFTKPMTTPDRKVIQPTGKAFKIPMATVGHSNKDGTSRGTVRLASSDPLVDARIAGMRIAQRVAQAEVLKPWAETIIPAPDASNAALAAVIPGDIGTVYHPVGTVRMGAADDPAAAVDARPRVKASRDRASLTPRSCPR